MEILMYVILYAVASFITGLLMTVYCSKEKLSSFSVFEILKFGFSTLSFLILIIAYLVISII
jgi:hypothetical protein